LKRALLNLIKKCDIIFLCITGPLFQLAKTPFIINFQKIVKVSVFLPTSCVNLISDIGL